MTPRLTGAETGSRRMAIDWVARKAPMVCHQCRKKGHFMSECRETERIRILELENEIKELKGKGGQ